MKFFYAKSILLKLSVFEQNFEFWTKFRVLNKISSFEQNFEFWTKFLFFFTKILIFDQNFDFWSKFRFIITISIFDQKVDFWPKGRFLTNISMFEQIILYILFYEKSILLKKKFGFRSKCEFLTVSRFWPKIIFIIFLTFWSKLSKYYRKTFKYFYPLFTLLNV